MKPNRILVLMHETLVPPDRLAGFTPQQIDEFRTEYDVVQQLKASGHDVRCMGLGDNLSELTDMIKSWRPHVAFNLAEEFQGFVNRDQHIVSFLELMKLPYTGCNPRGLVLSRDKSLSKQLLVFNGIQTPKFAVFTKGRRIALPENLSFPLFVKSVSDDASFGIAQASIVHDFPQLKKRIEFIHAQTGSDALVEEFISGRELYVGVIGNQRLKTYPIWELDFGASVNDGAAIATRKVKWDNNYRLKHGIDSRQARDLSPKIKKQIIEMAVRGYRALSLTGYARMDFRMSTDGCLYLLEANANPCLSAEDDFAQSAAVGGDDYAHLLERIMRLGKSYHSQSTIG
jgi:D-alanine-D-alanine ligase